MNTGIQSQDSLELYVLSNYSVHVASYSMRQKAGEEPGNEASVHVHATRNDKDYYRAHQKQFLLVFTATSGNSLPADTVSNTAEFAPPLTKLT